MSDVKKSYLNQTLSGSFSGVSGFLKNRKKFKDKQQVENELRKIRSFTLHKNIRRKFPRTPIKVLFLNETWSADLRDISNIKEHNNCNTFVLCVIDNFSKFAYTRPIKDKSADSMIKAFKSIFKEAGTTPSFLFTDQGLEFRGSKVIAFLKQHGVRQYNIYSHMKASICERFIQTLFTKLARYMTERETLKIDNVLQQFTTSYNSSYHSTIRRSPKEINKDNEVDVFLEVYAKRYKTKPKHPAKFKEGDIVKLSREKAIFEKGSAQNWTTENFKISEVRPTNPWTYYLVDMNNENVTGQMYGNELQLVERADSQQ